MMLKKFLDIKAQIWGSESHACTISYEVSTGRFYAECPATLEIKRLTDSNCRQVLNDMFMDYCTENAAWMGVD